MTTLLLKGKRRWKTKAQSENSVTAQKCAVTTQPSFLQQSGCAQVLAKWWKVMMIALPVNHQLRTKMWSILSLRKIREIYQAFLAKSSKICWVENWLSDCISRVCSVMQSCPTLYDPTDCSLPGSSVHGILQARILAWVAVPSSRGSSQFRVEPMSLMSPALQAGFFFNR